MIDRPRLLLACGTLLLAGLLYAVGPDGAVATTITELPRHLDQTVRVEGVLVASEVTRSGRSVLEVSDEGTAVTVSHPDRVEAPLGSWLALTGRVTRHDGAWWLHVPAGGIEVTPHAAPHRIEWEQLAAQAPRLTDRAIEIAGNVAGDHLEGSDHTLALGDGAWPDDGPVTAVGVLGYDPDCLCYRFHAGTVRVLTWD